jgi:hypothetical protein
MRFTNAAGALAHDAMHRVPGMPDHARATELNARHHRPVRNQPPGNRPIHNPGSRHGRAPRVLAGWQAWIGQRFRQGQR